jgi:DNA-directed RNA polymerase subunit H (RpoH/RPB5)
METILNQIGQINNSATARYNVVLERVLKTCIEMLRDRGYTLINDCRTIGDITYKMQENEHIISGEHSTEPDILIFFHNEERIGVKQMRAWNEKHVDEKIIIVSLEGPTAFTRKEAEQYYKNIEFFSFRNLCVNITKHHLVPKHEKLSLGDIETLSIHVAKNDEWPKLYSNDVIAQYYNYKPGDLIRITRTIGYPEPVYYYRLVCATPNV